MNNIKKTLDPIWETLELLPEKLRREILDFADSCVGFEEKTSEIRLRAGGRASLTYAGENVPLMTPLSKEEMERTCKNICDGSVYAHFDTINNGYVTLKNGFRAGLVGRAVSNGNEIVSVNDISSINIRIARDIRGLGRPILDIIAARHHLCGALIYSSPGVGKTTLLRSLAREIAKTKRVAVIDTRFELDISSTGGAGLADILSGYPKSCGIEIAARTLSPEYIICDEIGADEVDSVLSLGSLGVPLIASAHAHDYEALMGKRAIKSLFDGGVFDVCVGIARKKGADDFLYDIRYPGEEVCLH